MHPEVSNVNGEPSTFPQRLAGLKKLIGLDYRGHLKGLPGFLGWVGGGFCSPAASNPLRSKDHHPLMDAALSQGGKVHPRKWMINLSHPSQLPALKEEGIQKLLHCRFFAFLELSANKVAQLI